MSSAGFGPTFELGGLIAAGDTSVLVRRAAFTAEGSVGLSASMDPKDLTVSAR